MDWGAIHPDMGLSLERQQAANERVFRCFSFHLVLIPPRSNSTPFRAAPGNQVIVPKSGSRDALSRQGIYT
jgi:hypothetical protein